MRRITSHISLFAVLAAVSLFGLTATSAVAATGASTSLNKAELDKSVQEALAKIEAGGTSLGSQNAAAAGAETPSSSNAFGAPSESSSNLTSSAAGEEEESTAKTATTASGTSLSTISTGVVIPVGVVCIVLLGGIAFLILRDARSVAPVGDGLGSRSTAQENAVRRRKRRAKAKAARQQRKRNR
jgi:cobalamin biosynthesis Mg chelatase CobN